MGYTYTGRLFQRLISGMGTDDAGAKFNLNKYASALNRAGLFINAPLAGSEKRDESAQGVALAAGILLYLRSNWITMRDSAAQVNTALCRGCRTCAEQCPLIEMREGANGLLHSYLGTLPVHPLRRLRQRMPDGRYLPQSARITVQSVQH